MIQNMVLSAGLSESDASDVVQDTMVTVAQKIQTFEYDPQTGRFRDWLRTLVRLKLCEHWHRRKDKLQNLAPYPSASSSDPCGETDEGEEVGIPPELEAAWKAEWRQHVLVLARRHLQLVAHPTHYQVFDMAVFRELPLREVAKATGVNIAQVYLIRSRLSRLLRKEIKRLKAEA